MQFCILLIIEVYVTEKSANNNPQVEQAFKGTFAQKVMVRVTEIH